MAAKKRKKAKSLPPKQQAAPTLGHVSPEAQAMNDDLRRETISLLDRIVGAGPLTPDLQRRALEILASLAEAPANVGSEAAAIAMAGAAPSAAAPRRRLVYVHGICPHDPGYSNGWWEALRPFVPAAFGAGHLDDTRLEVLWSDLVNQASVAIAAAAAGAEQTFGATGAMPAAAASVVEERRRAAAEEIKETLRDRTEREVLVAAAESAGFAAGPMDSAEIAAFPSIPGLNCIDDFSVYLAYEETRRNIIDRFTAKVRAELMQGAELDIVAHSWGSVVAYEGLRELEDQGLTSPLVRNLFTVGSALSIGAVQRRLRPANRDGRRPSNVRRWVNLDARGDVVGGPLRGSGYAVDRDFVNLQPFGCGFFGALRPQCAHSSYFTAGNIVVNRDIFARYIDLP